ncbi:MAG: reverse transcriptase domain-containing protein [Chloroflexota bacterium]
MALLQWNCRGLNANIQELKSLINKFSPEAICLQETLLSENKIPNIPNYKPYNHFQTGNSGKPCGGSCVLVKKSTPHRPLPLRTQLQAVAVSLSLHKTLTICSVYLPPGPPIDPTDLDDLVEQLPPPFLILGDFNAHNKMWGDDRPDHRGKQIEDLINRHNLCIFNDKSKTYLHPATGSMTSVDLSLSDPSILLDYNWSVSEDLYGSDHFPIIFSSTKPILSEKLPTWNFKKADWGKFQFLATEIIEADLFDETDDPISLFSSILSDVAKEAVPLSSTKTTRTKKPWFTEDCKNALHDRKAALTQLKTNPSPQNLVQYKITRAKTRRIIRESKRKTWKEYVSKLNKNTPIKHIWKMIRKIKGNNSLPICHLKTEDNYVSERKEIANTLAETFAKNSSTQNYTPKFQNFKKLQERKKLCFDSDNSECYNDDFTLSELSESLKKAHETTPGPDNIPYQILKHLPTTPLLVLLDIYNKIWKTGNFPESWRKATIIPIPKPGKDHSNSSNYRPIALTSCLCKTLERMINNRLVWYLEKNNIITRHQSGFRRERSTIDQLVRLESKIRDTFVKKQHMAAVFFDLEKAYDTTWKYGILSDLAEMGLRGRLPIFIREFLEKRIFQVKVGTTFSDIFKQEMGVPQGSILSVTLFSIKINSIVKCLTAGLECSLYVDDFLICYSSENMATIERQLQLSLNRLQKWADENGFRFSKTKTVCMHFCQKRRLHPEPNLLLDGSPIPVVKETKFLGLIFDSKLNFIAHLKYLKTKCQKAMNLLKVVSKYDWGADRETLLLLYRSLIRSKLDYGSIVYGSARKSYLRMLDPIQNQALRLSLGAFRTSPIDSLYVEADEPPLQLRRKKLALQYALKLYANPDNPAQDYVLNPDQTLPYQNHPNAIMPLSLRVTHELSEILPDQTEIAYNVVLDTPPWELRLPEINLSLSSNPKSSTNPLVFQSYFNEIQTKYPDYKHIYTDGSKSGDRVGAAAVIDNSIKHVRLPDKSSIFTAELTAIQIALNHIDDAISNDFIIFSDSISSLQALQNMQPRNPLVMLTLQNYNNLVNDGKRIVLCWIPGHVGIKGNEKADDAAKKALNSAITTIPIPYTDLKNAIDQSITKSWQSFWDVQYDNKLHIIKPQIGKTKHSNRSNRREEVVLARTRIGHTYLTDCHLLKGEPRPMCIPCQSPLTTRHILLDCIDFAHIRQNYFTTDTLRELFETYHPDHILGYLKEIGLFYRF